MRIKIVIFILMYIFVNSVIFGYKDLIDIDITQSVYKTEKKFFLFTLPVSENTSKLKFKYFDYTIGKKQKIVLDLYKTNLRYKNKKDLHIKFPSDKIIEIYFGQYKPDIVRTVIFLKNKEDYEVIKNLRNFQIRIGQKEVEKKSKDITTKKVFKMFEPKKNKEKNQNFVPETIVSKTKSDTTDKSILNGNFNNKIKTNNLKTKNTKISEEKIIPPKKIKPAIPDYIILILKTSNKQQIKLELEKLKTSKKLNTIKFYDNFFNTYLLGKAEDYRNYAMNFVKLKMKLPYLTLTQIKKLHQFCLEMNKFDIKQNMVCKGMLDELLKMINEKISPVVKKEKKAVEVEFSFSIDWFKYNESELSIIKDKNIRDFFKGELERTFENNSYTVSNSGELKITGEILDFKVVDQRFNSNNEATEKRIEFLLDFEVIDSKSGQAVYSEKGVYIEKIYFTDKFQKEFGISDREALNQAIEQMSKKIYGFVEEFLSKKLTSPKGKKPKKLKLNALQKSILKGLTSKPKSKEKSKFIKGIISIENERTKVTGNLNSSGEDEKEFDKFTTSEKITFFYPFKNKSVLDGNVLVKTKSYEPKKVELEKIIAAYKTKNMKISAGNVFPFVSKMTFNNSLEGAMLDYKLPSNYILKALLGRDKEGKNNINYSKNSAGLNLGKTYQKKYKVNLNFVYTQDDKNSVDIDSTLTPVKNYLVGSNGKLKFSKALTVDYEFVWSYFNDNTKADSNIVYDNAINVKTSYKFKKSLTFLDYYRVGPDFNTMNGIATVDREKYTLGYTNKMKLLSLTTTSKYQKDNLENQEDKTNYLLEYNMNSSCNPLKSLKNLNFKKLMLSADLSYRRNYNELKNNPLSRDNDLRNWVYKLKVSNSMFKNAYSYYFSYEYEDENDKINFENTYTTNFEFYNGYKKKLLKLLNLDIKSKFRFKKVDEKIDRYLNGNFSLKYSKKKFSCLVDYYYDFNFSSTEDQDSKKQKLAFEVKYSHKKKKITNEYNLKVDYNFNKFENEENDYNKLLITTGLKVMF